jgi:uncharacterized repeat protein (TIGR03803 family)
MKTKQRLPGEFLHGIATILAVAVAAIALTSMGQAASTYQSIHHFTGADGAAPVGDLILDASGNLYGVATFGGSGTCFDSGCGAVFKLSKTSAGGWARTILYSFTGGNDGFFPDAGLVLDGSGNLYGTAAFGGAYHYGVVFKLSPTAAGNWKRTVLHAFHYGEDGATPKGKLVFDAAGNLYGTTQAGGGTPNSGIVFELSPTTADSWRETVLYRFTGRSDGRNPIAGLVFDAAGNLYGTTQFGGDTSDGVVFELSPNFSGGWTETVLHAFNRNDGEFPEASVIFGASGNLYGTTTIGGDLTACGGFGCGVVYELSPNSSGGWTETVLHAFERGPKANGGYGGAESTTDLAVDAAGNLYGTTAFGGRAGVYAGVVFKLSPNSDGTWSEAVLHAFYDNADGGYPNSGLTLDAAGTLFGMTNAGGNRTYCGGAGCGVVFEITP